MTIWTTVLPIYSIMHHETLDFYSSSNIDGNSRWKFKPTRNKLTFKPLIKQKFKYSISNHVQSHF